MKKANRPVRWGKTDLTPPIEVPVPKPLYPHTVTAASRIMLPGYVVLYTLIGLAFLLQKPQRTESPHFDIPRMLTGGTMEPWGVAFLAMAAVLAFGMFTHDRRLAQYTLVAGAGMAGFWGSLLIYEGFTHDDVSFSSGIWVLSWVACFCASVASLGRNEVS